jgi:hypothetical protein
MKTFLLIVAVFPFFLTLCPAEKPESPFACNRLALTAAQRKRHFDELTPKLRSLAKGAHELPEGYEFEFPGDPATYSLMVEWVAGEHLCCPFFDIGLRLDREQGPAWIRLTGRAGTKEFIRSDFSRWFKQ